MTIMTEIESATSRLFRSLKIAFMEYEYRNKHKPGCVLMELGAFSLFEHSNINAFRYCDQEEQKIFGIPVKEIMCGGYGIYLSDGPIAITIDDGTDSGNVLFGPKLAEIDQFMERRYSCWRNSFDRICSNPKTNANSIRHMNDEQLSEFLNSHMVCDCCVHEETCTDYSKPDQCRAGVLAWLQKPVQAKAGLAESAGGNQ